MAETGEHVLRERVETVLQKRHLTQGHSAAAATSAWAQQRFVARARALFYARMMFLTLGLLILAVPAWSYYFSLHGPLAFAVYFAMLLYSVANFMVIDHKVAGRYVTYLTLVFDLIVTVLLIAKPNAANAGLNSPLLATQLLFTMLFALLFPRPLAILPPLLALPITTRLDQILNRDVSAVELFTLLWYAALNFIVIYVLVYLGEQETAAHHEVVQLQTDLKELAVVEERSRLAREIHDGLGASLSSLIIQSEYLLKLTREDAVRSELEELKRSAEEAIEELRRSLQMMREDFELTRGLSEYVATFRDRTQLPVTFERSGAPPPRLSPDVQLTCFRILQECLSNAVKHAHPTRVDVKLSFDADRLSMAVVDDGVGFDPGKPRVGHYGMLHMVERARSAGGQIVLESAPGQGTRISLFLPLPAAG